MNRDKTFLVISTVLIFSAILGNIAVTVNNFSSSIDFTGDSSSHDDDHDDDDGHEENEDDDHDEDQHRHGDDDDDDD